MHCCARIMRHVRGIRKAIAFSFLIFSVGSPRAATVSIAPAADATLYESATGALANGSGQFLFVGRTGQVAGLSLRRALIRFDVAGSIPAGSTINSVELKMTVSKTISGAQTTNLHRVTADWGEGASQATGDEGGGVASATGDATWIHRTFNTTPWTTAGGDFAAGVSGTASVDGLGEYTWTSTAQMVADVQGWLNAPAGNFGWAVLGVETSASTAKRFNSRSNSTGKLLGPKKASQVLSLQKS